MTDKFFEFSQSRCVARFKELSGFLSGGIAHFVRESGERTRRPCRHYTVNALSFGRIIWHSQQIGDKKGRINLWNF